jgi:hypothetical protein
LICGGPLKWVGAPWLCPNTGWCVRAIWLGARGSRVVEWNVCGPIAICCRFSPVVCVGSTSCWRCFCPCTCEGDKFAPMLSLCGGKVGGGAVTLVVCGCWASSSKCRLTTLVSITVWVLVLTGSCLAYGKVKTVSNCEPSSGSFSIASPRPW